MAKVLGSIFWSNVLDLLSTHRELEFLIVLSLLLPLQASGLEGWYTGRPSGD